MYRKYVKSNWVLPFVGVVAALIDFAEGIVLSNVQHDRSSVRYVKFDQSYTFLSLDRADLSYEGEQWIPIQYGTVSIESGKHTKGQLVLPYLFEESLD